MRLIGNKTKLVPAIEDFLARRGVTGGTLLDVFAGTASVARHFRGRGFRVRSNDLLWSSYAVQRAYVQTGDVPDLSGVVATAPVRRFRRPDDLATVLAYLDGGLPPREGLVSRQYAEGGPAGRLFFSRGNGLAIDAVHGQLLAWRAERRLDDDGFYLLLALLLEAADRVANISGTYGAFLKHLQPSAREPLRLRAPDLPLAGPPGRATRLDANLAVRRTPVDTLYIDPPYNHRQYVKNYHVLEVVAELHTVDDPAAYEASIYGKTGLRGFEDRLSSYCRRVPRGRAASCEQAFRDLVAGARAEHIVVSYSEEGILSREAIGRALAAAAGQRAYDFDRDHEEIAYKRFRSDKDGQGRAYKVLDGRSKDEVREWLFYVRKPRARRPASRRVAVGAARA
ncbi:MAG: DNA adenine methylase [Planctomycetes bacterium]|nr:DNA adenine methylase [Planctomycetota bacterium]